MKKYLSKAKRLIRKFKEASFLQVPKEENMEVDALAKAASADGSMDELDEVQYMPSIDLPEVQQIERRRKLDDPNSDFTSRMNGFQKKGTKPES